MADADWRQLALDTLPKEWVHDARVAAASARTLLLDEPADVLVHGGSAAVGTVQALVSMHQSARGGRAPRELRLSGEEAGALCPLLQRALRRAGVPTRVRHLDDSTDVRRPRVAIIFDVPVLSPSLSLHSFVESARRSGCTLSAPLTVEVWAVLLDGSAGGHAHAPLDDLIRLRREIAEIDLEPLAEARASFNLIKLADEF